MLTLEEWQDRLAIETQSILREQTTFQPIENNYARWRGEILGNGLYDGVFVLDIVIPRSYPFSPPICRFLTPIWHVNIHKNKICVGILGDCHLVI